MHVLPEWSSTVPNRGGRRSPLSVRPVYEPAAGRVVRSGLLAIAHGLVAPRPFWELLQWLAARAEWLRATFALASRPQCYGVARADRGSPVAGFCGTWRSTPRLKLVVAGKNLSEETIGSALSVCLSAAFAQRDDDLFPRWQPGDPWTPVFWENAC